MGRHQGTTVGLQPASKDRIGSRTTRPAANGSGPLTAGTADRHVLYEISVQSVDFELDLFERIYRKKRGRAFTTLREGFCGTAALAASWVARRPANHAIGVDLHRPTLDWAVRHNLPRLGDATSRLALIQANVLDVDAPRVDVLAALNYSYWVFKDRETLRRYFRIAHRSLRRDGIFFADVFGGTDATKVLREERKIPASSLPDGRRVAPFTYVWDQAHFNPVSHDLVCRIHFKFRDGTKLKNAFTYRWRYWSLPEIQEVMREAGFRDVEVWLEGWDDDADEANGVFRVRKQVEEMEGWVGYVVGYK
jgi:SAM-dependent methyltransferase